MRSAFSAVLATDTVTGFVSITVSSAPRSALRAIGSGVAVTVTPFSSTRQR